MRKEHRPDEGLKAFEAALAALRPAGDPADDTWRASLAKLVEKGIFSSPAVEHPAEASPLRCGRGGHRFVCIRCGMARERGGSAGRWAWPAALAAMTGVAAVAVAMLLIGPASNAIGPTAERAVASVERDPVAVDSGRDDLAVGRNDWSPMAERSFQREDDTSDVQGTRASYLVLRNRVLRDGLSAWPMPRPTANDHPSPPPDRPTSRGELERLLREQG